MSLQARPIRSGRDAAIADGEQLAEAEVKTARDQLTNEVQKKEFDFALKAMELDQREADMRAPASNWRLSSARPLRWRPDNQRNSAMGPRRTRKARIPAPATLTASIGLTVPEDGGRHKKRMRASSWRPDKTFAGATMERPRRLPSDVLKTTDAPFYYDGICRLFRFH